jgi:hypothetical protein
MATRITLPMAMRHTHGVGETPGAISPPSSSTIRGKNITISAIIWNSITARLDMGVASTMAVVFTAAVATAVAAVTERPRRTRERKICSCHSARREFVHIFGHVLKSWLWSA